MLILIGGVLIGFSLSALRHRESPVLRLAPGDAVHDTVYIFVGPDSIMRIYRGHR